MRTVLVYTIVGLLAGFAGRAQNRLQPPLAELPIALAATVGMSQDTITKVLELIRTNPPNDFRGLVVIKDNKLVVEEYFSTYWRETIHDIRSAGKSVTALLLGIAIDKGLVKSEEQSIYDFFPAYKKSSSPDIRIKHLLAMSSGLSADDDDPDSPGRTSNWLTSMDWVGFALSLPMAFKPGEKFAYTDVCPMLIGAIIEQKSGKPLSAFAKEHLFTPLGIREYYWYTAPNGSTVPMGNLYISTLDFAKLGQLVINDGKWAGRKIVSAEWTRKMGQKQLKLENPFADNYGYFWYASTREINGKKYDYVFASGNGGNVLFVVPSENLVVSVTSSAYGQGYGHFRSHNIFKYVLRSIVTR